MKKYYLMGAASLIILFGLFRITSFGVNEDGQMSEGDAPRKASDRPREIRNDSSLPEEAVAISRPLLPIHSDRMSRAEIASAVHEKGIKYAWSLAQKADGEIYRAALEEEILKQWGILGNIDDGLTFLEQNTGPGTRREKLAYSLVYQTSLKFSELLGLHQGASDEFIASGLLKGLKFRVMDDGLKPSDLEGLNLTKDVKSAVEDGMGVYASQRKTVGERIATVREIRQLGLNPDPAITRIVGASSLSKLKEMFLVSADDTTPEIKRLYAASGARLAYSSPEWLIRSASERGLQLGMDSVIKATIDLANADSTKAIGMLKEVDEGDHRLGSQMTVGIALAAGQAGEFDTAREWLALIDDQSVRKHGEDQLWREERKTVSRLAENEPLRALNEIQNGESIHPDYWIKEVFSVWLKNSRSEALGWYQENGNSLKPEHNQHIARVYGELALNEGDINLARQWAEQVIDPNFKQKLVEQIDGAAGKTE